MLQDMAEQKFYDVVKVFVKEIFTFAVIFCISLPLIALFDMSGYVFAVVGNILSYLAVVVAIFSAVCVFDSVRKIRRQVGIYKGDLRRIQEKMTYSDIYMDIPDEDMYKFDKITYVVKASVKRMKKST